MNRINFFADASFLISYYNKSDNKHDLASDIYESLLEKEFIENITDMHLTKFIIAETLHKIQPAAPTFKDIKNCYDELKNLQLHVVNESIFEDAFHTKLGAFCNHKTKKPKEGMGIVDAISLQIMEIEKITYILTFDSHFDNIPFCTPISSIDETNL